MRTDPQALDGQTLDFVVVGGGIQGAALAREAALAGCSVLLVERSDFGSETSSHSSRLVHGGLRYLENGHLALVREALAERERLLRLAPHLVHPQPMLMPFFRGASMGPWKIRAGLWLYDLLAKGSSLPRARSHDAEACVRLFPGLRREGLRGGAVFYDARTVDQRLTFAVVEAAHAAGAMVANHLEVLGHDGGRLLLLDRLASREVRVTARSVLNAAGPFVDELRQLLGIEGAPLVRRSRGSHIVLDPVAGEVALAAFLPDKRIQFVIPHDGGTLCGTTEVEEDRGPLRPEVPQDDIDYLLGALDYLLAGKPTEADIRHGYVGWRALPAGAAPSGALHREAFLVAETSPVGQVHTLVGGKLTTHRSFAERAIRGLVTGAGPSPSRIQPLPGGAGPQEFLDPLWWRHGDRAPSIRALARELPGLDLLDPICPHRDLLRVEAVFALRHQATHTFADLVRRRLFHVLGPCLEPPCLDTCRRLYEEFAVGPSQPHAAADLAP